MTRVQPHVRARRTAPRCPLLALFVALALLPLATTDPPPTASPPPPCASRGLADNIVTGSGDVVLGCGNNVTGINNTAREEEPTKLVCIPF